MLNETAPRARALGSTRVVRFLGRLEPLWERLRLEEGKRVTVGIFEIHRPATRSLGDWGYHLRTEFGQALSDGFDTAFFKTKNNLRSPSRLRLTLEEKDLGPILHGYHTETIPLLEFETDDGRVEAARAL